MGNIISAITPNQFLPVETLIGDVKDAKFVANLGSTRFMKVARVSTEEGSMVFKVFVPHQEGFSTNEYVEQVIQIRDLLYSAYNCCPFSGVRVTPRCTILSRQYHKETLYNRLSIRPYLLDIEKRWISFQLLKALAQCEAADLCHGDLKTQNVLISSYNWVQITDFATFKPAYVASDDPSYFNFFFDTSRRRTCYLAPERFYPGHKIRLHGEGRRRSLNLSKRLTKAMDIFAMGCLLVELNSLVEEFCPFTYGKIIKYKDSSAEKADEMLEDILKKVPKDMQVMLKFMLSRSPSERLPATKLLQIYGPLIFPPYFESFLYKYLNIFRPKVSLADESSEKSMQVTASMDSNDVINTWYKTFQCNANLLPKLEKLMKMHCTETLWNDMDNIMENLKNETPIKRAYMDPTALIISLLTSNMRALKTISSKMRALKMLERLAAVSSPSVVADRILPYIVNMLTDSVTLIRSEAITSISKILSSLKEVSLYETRLFTDYLFPHFKAISTDASVLVQMTLAENLGILAETSVKFLWHNSKNLTEDILGNSIINDGERDMDNEKLAELELQALHDSVNEIFINLCGSDNCVKHCLVSRDSLKMLCQFFNRQKATDVLLSHAITFLNDKTDWRLRATFFESCPIIATFVGPQSTFILRSLLQQGLRDYEEFVQLQALRCIYKLCQQQLLDKAAIYELFPDVIPFLSHPNEWLRLATVNILVALDSILNIADIHIKLMPILSKYITEDHLIRLNHKFAIISILQPSIPRSIWEYLIGNSSLAFILDFIAEKQMIAALGGDYESITSSQMRSSNVMRPHDLKVCAKRLETLGLTQEYEEKILKFDKILRITSSLSGILEQERMQLGVDGLVDLCELNANLRSFNLSVVHDSKPEDSECDTQEMVFGDNPEILITSNTKSDSSTTPDSLPTSGYLETDGNLCASWDVSIPTSSCRSMLSKLMEHKRERFRKLVQCYPVRAQDDDGAIVVPSPTKRRRWSQLVLTINAHQGSIIKKLAMDEKCSFFASGGSNGVVKIWSINRLQTYPVSSLIPGASFSYGNRILSLGFMNNNHERLALVGGDSRICVVDVERGKLITSVNLANSKDGPPLDLIAVDNLLHVRTQDSVVVCYDCRLSLSKMSRTKPSPIWRFKISNEHGFVNSFCLDPMSSSWMCLTSTNKLISLWDLRFGLEVKSWHHPNEKCRFMRCWPAVKRDNLSRTCNEIWTSSSCNGEISRWKLETAQRSHVLWPSMKLPLDYANNKHITTALTTCPLTRNVITGDNHGAIRLWDTRNVNECRYLSGPLKMNPDIADFPTHRRNSIGYQRSVEDTASVIAEVYSEYKVEESSSFSDQTASCHKTAIEDLLCTGDLLISASRDGIIKVWK